ncbi:DUF4956 domain-containing protein [Plebeiibacterium sediminum]|uniref:DUF4956 domain-containing protein n=1 Tax=Plebeiibacterium sediminum TaxID=2992112 RepID=A0AAE3M1H7_9BACT|nr:DUF4956 domain-containing protein [Plebeiobacterium sediminum]MCW3785196.1 DUF4956 domain-containing protein [Plebeiobacterium sediminum]
MANLIYQLFDYKINLLSAMGGWDEKLSLFGIQIIDISGFTELAVRFLFNTVLLLVVVHFIYAKNSRRKDFYFSYLSIGVIVFLLCFLLNSVKLELGFAMGLFAIFGIIRYRTDAIPIKEMTYLFIVIGISVMNALAHSKLSYSELVFTNVIIIAGLWFLEKRLSLKQEQSVTLIYEKIENIHKHNSSELLDDLRDRTGININRYEINKIDFLRDVAEITLYFHVNGNIQHKE